MQCASIILRDAEDGMAWDAKSCSNIWRVVTHIGKFRSTFWFTVNKKTHLLCQISITFACMNAIFMVMPDSWISTQVLIKRFTKYASVSLQAQRFGLPLSMAAPASSGVSESDMDINTSNSKLNCLLPSSIFPRKLVTATTSWARDATAAWPRCDRSGALENWWWLVHDWWNSKNYEERKEWYCA